MIARVVITGLGAVAPNGFGVEPYWAATRRGETGIRPLTRFDPAGYPLRVAGEIVGFDPAQHVAGRLLPQTDRMTHLAFAASDQAVSDAGGIGSDGDPQAVGVITAAASGGFEFGQRELQNLWRDGSKYVSAYMSFAWFYAVNSGQLSIRHNARGPSGVFVGEQAGGLDAVAQARRLVRGGLRFALSGGIDSSLCPFGWVSHLAGGRLSQGENPGRAYLPFDVDAGGHVPGEGGAMLVLEEARAARARGAGHVYGEIAGYGASFDPAPGSGREPTLRAAVQSALADARMAPRDIGVVFADGAGTPEADQQEAAVLASLFGAYGVPVTAPKSMTGRLYSGGAPLDLVTALLAIRDGIIPPTVNSVAVRPEYRLDLVVGAARPAPVRSALVLARGVGGFNAAMIVRAVDPD